MTDPDGTPSVHRALDRAFEGVALTPEVQDLKEEIRANLVARVAELQAAGRSPDEAVRAAVDEVGDLRAVVAEVAADALAPGTVASTADAWAAHQRLTALHRVRPRPAFVVAAVVLSAALAVALALVVLVALDVTHVARWDAIAKGVAAALLAGGVVVLALRQETTTHYPMPTGRAVGWGAAAAAGTLAVALGTLFAGDTSQVGLFEAALGLAVASVAALVTLGVTQTNRTKGWVRDAAGQPPDRFSRDPAAAARFGLYSGVLWLAAFAAVVVVGLTAGWLWSWTPLLAAFLLEMVLLARMLFPADEGHRSDRRG